jgi:ABC-type protease/lipase transport system fused ATPase/permease subunit
MLTLNGLRDVLAQWDEAHADVDSRGFTEDEELLAGTGEQLANALREMLDEPTTVQALALARLMRDRPNAQVVVHQGVFDLPQGYWLAIIGTDGFQCGIAPNGDVSS